MKSARRSTGRQKDAQPPRAFSASKYEERFCDALVAHMTDGYSFESFAGVIGIGRRSLFNWQNAHPEFKDAHDRASCAALLW